MQKTTDTETNYQAAYGDMILKNRN